MWRILLTLLLIGCGGSQVESGNPGSPVEPKQAYVPPDESWEESFREMPLLRWERWAVDHPGFAKENKIPVLTLEGVKKNRENVIRTVKAKGWEADFAKRVIEGDQTNPPALGVAACLVTVAGAILSPSIPSVAAAGLCSGYYGTVYAHDWWQDYQANHLPFGGSFSGFLERAFCTAHNCHDFHERSDFDDLDR